MILPIVEVEPSRKGRMDSVNSLELAACTFNNCSTLQLARIIIQNVASHLPTMLHARFLTLNYSSHKLQEDKIENFHHLSGCFEHLLECPAPPVDCGGDLVA